MNLNERAGDLVYHLDVVMRALKSGLWTATPGIIESFDAEAMTCTVQPAIQALVRDEQGQFTAQPYPLLADCPVQFPAGGGCTLTFPVKQGDECLIVFSSRCIDSWWQSGGLQVQSEIRMHDQSDGFVLLGFRSLPRVIPNVSTEAAQLRSDDGTTFVEVAPTGGVTITAPAGLTINADVTVNGRIDTTGDVKAASISLQGHTHPDAQGGNTGAPNP